MKQNITYDKAYNFALKIVSVSTKLRKNNEYVLSKQLLRSGTSIGANVAEANGAISKVEFSTKISIAYKEALETKYWVDLLFDSKFIEKALHNELIDDVDEICKILFSILKTTRIKK